METTGFPLHVPLSDLVHNCGHQKTKEREGKGEIGKEGEKIGRERGRKRERDRGRACGQNVSHTLHRNTATVGEDPKNPPQMIMMVLFLSIWGLNSFKFDSLKKCPKKS